MACNIKGLKALALSNENWKALEKCYFQAKLLKNAL
jgi:hypothetical protein